jgi:hypothetical protein
MIDISKMTEAEKEAARKRGWLPMFAHRDSVSEAYTYAMDVAVTLCSKDKAAAITAIQVLVNTYALQLSIKEKEK